MKKLYFYLAISGVLLGAWRTYRLFSDLPLLQTQATWITVLDILCIVAYFGLSVYYWLIYAKSKKTEDAE